MIALPISYVFGKFLKKLGMQVPDFETVKERYNKASLEFPGGINDWFAYGLTGGVFYTIFLVIAFTYDLTYCSKNCVMFIFIVIAIYLYYQLYYKDIEWLKKKINKISKKFYVK
jgi:hypothetical protein